MRNIRCIVCYDGTDFSGWQRQKNARTVQEVLENALTKLHGTSITVTGAGRTDAGVHATGQVINFTANSSIPVNKYCYAINQHLAADVRITAADEVDPSFHSRKCATSRSYRYLIRVDDIVNPIDRNFCYRIARYPDITKLNAMAATLVGTHDFATFSAAGGNSVTTMRDISTASFHVSGSYLEFRITANAFLWKMVRSVVGTLLKAETEGKSAEDFRMIRESCDRAEAGTTAPGRGLYLHHVDYSGERIHA